MSQQARYVIVGAGAVGGTVAARLSHAGHDVVVVARGEHADAIEADGLLLRTPEGDIRGHPVVWRTPEDAQLKANDVLILAVKSQDADEALAPWTSLLLDDGRQAGAVLPVLVAMNGVTGEDIALRHARRVYGVCVWTPATYLRPGEVSSYFTPASGVFHIGRVPSARSTESDTAFLDEMAQAWNAAGLMMLPQQEVMGWKWRKLLNNVGNAFDAVCGDVTDPRELEIAHVLQARARQEAEVVFAAAGITLVDHEVERRARREGPSFGHIAGAAYQGSSSRQSLSRGTGSIESAYLNGEVARLAHLCGVDAPVNAGIVGICTRAARLGIAPGEWAPSAVARELGV